MNYYNEWDKGAAAWLRELIRAGHIPPGDVDERSITEVTASDLAGYTQCHFFAGIGGWSYALALAGIPATTQLWTGSPPCPAFRPQSRRTYVALPTAPKKSRSLLCGAPTLAAGSTAAPQA